MSALNLTESERTSPLWKKITDYLAAQIEADRIELEKVGNNKAYSDDVLKGKILAWRRLLAKGKEHQPGT